MCTTRRTWKPGVSASTMKQVMPPRPFSASVRAKTRPKCAWSAPEMKILEPLMTQPLVLGSARVWMARAGSLPPDGSVRPKKRLLLAAQHRIEVALLLVLVGLVELGQAGAAEDAVAGHVEAGAVLGHLDRQQHAGDDVDVRGRRTRRGCRGRSSPIALVFSTRRAMVLGRQLGGVGIELGLERHDLLAHEAADLVDQHLLFGVGSKSIAFRS